MSHNENEHPAAGDELLERLKELEERVSYLEEEAGISISKRYRPLAKEDPEKPVEEILSGSLLESRFGEFGLAWLGNLVMLFGIIFLAQYLQNTGYKYFSSALGYIAVIGIFGLAYYFRGSQRSLTSVFRLTGYILLYFITLRLHFFTKDPILTGPYFCLALLVVVSFIQGYIAFRERSQRLAMLAIVMTLVTAVVSNSTHFMLLSVTALTIASIFFMVRFGWWRVLIFTVILVYLANLIWLTGNPFMNHPIQVIQSHEFGYIYLFIAAAIFSIVGMIKQKGLFPDQAVIATVILNGLGFSLVITLYVLAFFKENYIPVFAIIALFCLAYSLVLQKKSSWKVIASLYALYSFVALSVMVYGIYGFPRAYFLLSLQSLLVLSMALWFRSKVIVIMNTFLFIILLFAYFFSSPSADTINISFALVALVTARVLNWKKERLEIRTEMLRNTFLIIGFCMVLYALYMIMPGRYVTLSWTVAAGLYFLLSIVLHNVKYRYLALATMASAAIHLFISDLARVELIFRIVALLFLALISLVLSLYYSRRLKKKAES